MKPFLLIMVTAVFFPAGLNQNNLLTEARSKIARAFEDESVCDELYKKFSGADVSSDPLLRGYKASLTMAKSKHFLNPFKKLSYFNSGKDELEQAIALDSTSIELRFLRFQIQYNTPSFLGYKDQLQNDKAFISRNLENVPNEELRNKIASFISKAEL